jgi:hypothetical protein
MLQTLAPANLRAVDGSCIKLGGVARELRRAPSSPNTEGIKPRCSESIEFDHSLSQMFIGIREFELVSGLNRHVRASLHHPGEFPWR